MQMLDFFDRVTKWRSFSYFTKSDSTTDALPAILKFLRTNKGTLAVESFFGIVIGGWIGQLEFFERNAIKYVFLIIFQNFHNSNFSNVLSKKCEEIFFEAFS